MGAVAKMKKSEMIDWSEDRIAELRLLWDRGLSLSDIAFAMNRGSTAGIFTKNAVTGKAHRLNLPRRPSPIVSYGEPSPYRHTQTGKPKRPPGIARTTGPTLPSLAGFVASVAVAAPIPAPPAPKPHRPAPAPLQASPVTVSRHRCQWIFGDDTHRHRVRFCTAGAVSDKPYCAEHCARAYDGVPKKLPNVFLNYDRKVSPIRLPPGR
jgi:GcrA cell cycle regulator